MVMKGESKKGEKILVPYEIEYYNAPSSANKLHHKYLYYLCMNTTENIVNKAY